MGKQIKINKVFPFVALFVFIYWRRGSVILTHDLPRRKRRYLRVSSAKNHNELLFTVAGNWNPKTTITPSAQGCKSLLI